MTIQELEKFIEKYGSSIYSFCRKLCIDNDFADELYQEVWLKAIQDIDKINAGGNVKSFLLSLAVGIWKNNKKKYAIRYRIAPSVTLTDEIEHNISDKSQDILEQVIIEERKQAVIEAVSKLDDVYRVPILLFYMEGQSIKAIAKEIHVPEGTVKRRLWAARKKLSQELEVYIGHE